LIIQGMSRIARIVVLHYPHHVTQCGNPRQQTFFSDDDHRPYIELMSHWCGKNVVDIWGVLFDAQSCSSDRGSGTEGRVAAGHR